MSKTDKESFQSSVRSSRRFVNTLSIDIARKLDAMSEYTELTAGDGFGEQALMNDKPRGATILCKTDVHVAVMNKYDFKI